LKHILTFILTVSTIALFSCGLGGKRGKTAATDAASQYDGKLVAGKVLDTITCENMASQTYTLYLPKRYTIAQQYPCIIFFDPHGCGALPVNMYKDLAEEYGFVLVGSDYIKNGMSWPETEEGVKALLDDIRMRVNLDMKRMYTSGFSGGSRVAVTVAALMGKTAGVIGAGAGFPKIRVDLQSTFYYFGIAGAHDFNLSEMKEWGERLEQSSFVHYILTSAGKHEWPAPADMKLAMQWMLAQSMRDQTIGRDSSLLTALKADYQQRIAAARSAGSTLNAYSLQKGMVEAIDTLLDLTPERKQLAEMAASSSLKQAQAQAELIKHQENVIQEEISNTFTTWDEKTLNDKLSGLIQRSHAGSLQEAQMGHRMLAYFGFACYMAASNALNTGDLVSADRYITAFKKADPDNPDGSFLTAVYYMKKQDRQQALTALETAAAQGYNDVQQMVSEGAFAVLLSDLTFTSILGRVEENGKMKK